MAAKITEGRTASTPRKRTASLRLEAELLDEINEWCGLHDRTQSWLLGQLARMAWPRFRETRNPPVRRQDNRRTN